MDTKQSSPQVTDSALRQPPEFPTLPADVLARFPSLAGWADQVARFWQQSQNGLQDFAHAVLDVTEIAGVFTVDGNVGSVYIKSSRNPGAYDDPDTPFYVDRAGFFSLKNKLTWDPTTDLLTVTGTIIASAGVIGGWNISATTLSKNNAILDSAGQLLIGTGNDVVILSATDATYRIWAGNATGGAASFSVTKAGVLYATGATVSGSITATSGNIGGFNIGTDYIRDVGNSMGLASTVTGGDDVRFWAGQTFANRATAPFRVTEAGVVTATSGTIGGWTLSATTLSASNVVIDSTGQIALGTGNDIVILSAANATFRVWIGNATAGSASFSVTKAGALFSNSGTIGGFTISATTLTAGAGMAYISLSSTGSIVVGDPTGLTSAFDPAQISIGNNTGIITWRVLDLGTSTVMEMWNSAGVSKFSVTANSGNVVSSGSVTAASFSGDGSALSALNAGNVSSGTLNNSRLPTTISVANVTASGVITAAAGSAGSPSITFAGATTTGLFLDTDKVATTVGGTSRFTVSSTRVACLVDLKINNAKAAGAPTPGGTVTIRDSNDSTISLITT